jgi:CubicO group peptidase (beta-lactamase class C family)
MTPRIGSGIALALFLVRAAFPQQPAAIADGWKTASLEAAGMDHRLIDAMTAEIRRYPDWNIHAVLIERDGRLVYEQYFAGEDQQLAHNLGRVVFTRDTKHDIRSITKSVTSALVGIALASGRIRSLDQSLLDFFPEQAAARRPGQPRISLLHALTMSAGLDWNEDIPYTDPRNDEVLMDLSKDPVAYVLTRPMVAEPGAVWKYNGGLPQLLATIVQRTTGEPLRDYARAVLFAPLGITDFEWWETSPGCPRRHPGCNCARVIWPSSARCICTTASGTGGRSCRRIGCANPQSGGLRCRLRLRATLTVRPATGTCGGTPASAQQWEHWKFRRRMATACNASL